MSTVEQALLKSQKFPDNRYWDFNVKALVVESFPLLGRLTAARFLEWAMLNPEGVVSLPTGKTPEYFINNVLRFLHNWDKKSIQKELYHLGIHSSKKPKLRGLRFIQIDEFYPMNPHHHNSFYYYVNKYYINGFGLDPKRALLIDCSKISIEGGMDLDEIWADKPVDLSLRYVLADNRQERLKQKTIQRVDQWCTEYEQKIRDMGGIGFFLGGIGPDGHIGFNISGADRFSTTRLTEVNYETKAAASSDLGGIETANKRVVITIGLSTITFNKNCTAIIMVAGEAKAKIVKKALTLNQSNNIPATSMIGMPNARFFLTKGAAKLLKTRNITSFEACDKLNDQQIENIVIELAVRQNKKIEELTKDDYAKDDFAKVLLKKNKREIKDLNSLVIASIKKKIEAGIHIDENKRYLHTEPHHDDIMLGYMPFVVRAIRIHNTHHHFATLTSGFTSVTNSFMLQIFKKLSKALEENGFDRLFKEGYFDPKDEHFRNRDVWKYLEAIAQNSTQLQTHATLRRLLRNLNEVFEQEDLQNLKDRVGELINYFKTQYPGKKDLPFIQKLKGMTREWESSCLWGYFGWDASSIDHLRLGFYSGDIFTANPTYDRDILPIVKLLNRVNPDVVSVAFDPEGSGPDTHYKVLQAIAEALKVYEKQHKGKKIEVLGYRNVWYRFHPSEANIFVPVSLQMFTLMHQSFMNTYLSQKGASFPSYELNEPFPLLSQKIQVEQYNKIKTCLGNDYFFEHPSALMRCTRGFAFVKKMTTEQFYGFSRELKEKTEL